MKIKGTFLFLIVVFFCNVCIASTFYINPIIGSNLGDGSLTSPWHTLEHVVNSNFIESRSYVTPYDQNAPQIVDKNLGAPIKAGDTIILYTGLHGEVFLNNYVNADFITIKAARNNYPIIKNIHVRAGKKWRIEGVRVSSEPYGSYISDKLIFLESHSWQGPVSSIEIKDCELFSTNTAWTLANDWVTKASSGIVIRGDSILVENNSLENIRLGITMQGENIQVIGNSIKNFSADGIRILGSNNLVELNTIKNCYDVDGNHDDGIQSYTTGGLVVDNNIVRRNMIINYENPNQPLLGSLQGIGCFNGPFNNWIVENNLVIVDHWHGVSFYGGHNCHIINNTIIDPTPDITPGPAWIKIEDLNGNPSSNCMVKNNVSNDLAINPNSNTNEGNNVQLTSYTEYATNFMDYSNIDFHLQAQSVLIDSGDLMVSPTMDLEGTGRNQGLSSDVGAYEYVVITANKDFIKEGIIKIYPNPTQHKLQIEGELENAKINVWNELGRLVKTFTDIKLPYAIDLESLPCGVYMVQIMDSSNIQVELSKIIKQ